MDSNFERNLNSPISQSKLQESDAESSDDPDFMGGNNFDSYAWKHSSAQKRKKSKAKKAEMARLREKRLKERGYNKKANKERAVIQRKQRAADYEGFVVTTKAILERYEVLPRLF